VLELPGGPPLSGQTDRGVAHRSAVWSIESFRAAIDTEMESLETTLGDVEALLADVETTLAGSNLDGDRETSRRAGSRGEADSSSVAAD